MRTSTDLIRDIQSALLSADIAGWLFYGFHNNDPIALSILRFGDNYHATRRWFYLVPVHGEPLKLVHRIESAVLDHLPGRKLVYLTWQELSASLATFLAGVPRVAMQYSPENRVPYISRVDGGTVELIRSKGTEVVSSADLVQAFEACWSEEQASQHRDTALALTEIVQEAFREAARLIDKDGKTDELRVQRFIQDRFDEHGLVTDSPPIVAVNGNAGNPHYSPSKSSVTPIGKDDFLLIDLWAKPAGPESVYADITWTAFYGREAPERIQTMFNIVRQARDRGAAFLRQAVDQGRIPQGWQVDDEVRAVIREAGYGEHFVHRTGHSLGREVHGNGVNFDNLETHDTRAFIPGVACTIEPGIYLPDFGVRSEINIYFGRGGPEVTTPPQQSLLLFE
jgi:Xaa-Pro dipeptidase